MIQQNVSQQADSVTQARQIIHLQFCRQTKKMGNIDYQISGNLGISILSRNDFPVVDFRRRVEIGYAMRSVFSLSLEAWQTLVFQTERFKNRETFETVLDEANHKWVSAWKGSKGQYFVSCIDENLHISHRFVTFQEDELCTFLIYAPLITMDILSANVSRDWVKASKIVQRIPPNKCSECGDILKAKILRHGRGVQNKCFDICALSSDRCSYCGLKWESSDCHCHLFDCKTCEPRNFCRKCDGLLFYPDTKSKLG